MKDPHISEEIEFKIEIHSLNTDGEIIHITYEDKYYIVCVGEIGTFKTVRFTKTYYKYVLFETPFHFSPTRSRIKDLGYSYVSKVRDHSIEKTITILEAVEKAKKIIRTRHWIIKNPIKRNSDAV